jgi:hypothetical protein
MSWIQAVPELLTVKQFIQALKVVLDAVYIGWQKHQIRNCTPIRAQFGHSKPAEANTIATDPIKSRPRGKVRIILNQLEHRP